MTVASTAAWKWLPFLLTLDEAPLSFSLWFSSCKCWFSRSKYLT